MGTGEEVTVSAGLGALLSDDDSGEDVPGTVVEHLPAFVTCSVPSFVSAIAKWVFDEGLEESEEGEDLEAVGREGAEDLRRNMEKYQVVCDE